MAARIIALASLGTDESDGAIAMLYDPVFRVQRASGGVVPGFRSAAISLAVLIEPSTELDCLPGGRRRCSLEPQHADFCSMARPMVSV